MHIASFVGSFAKLNGHSAKSIGVYTLSFSVIIILISPCVSYIYSQTGVIPPYVPCALCKLFSTNQNTETTIADTLNSTFYSKYIITNPENGTIVETPTSLHYVPNKDFVGVDTILFEQQNKSNPDSLSVIGGIKILINPSPSPTLINDPVQRNIAAFSISFATTIAIFLILRQIGKRNFSDIIRDTDLHPSLSRFQCLLWTFVVLFSFFGIWLTRTFGGVMMPIQDSLPVYLLAIIGISVATPIISRLLSLYEDVEIEFGKEVSSNTDDDAPRKKNRPNLGEMLREHGKPSLSRFQMFAWTWIGIGIFLAILFSKVIETSNVQNLFIPDIGPALVILTGLSHLTFLIGKALNLKRKIKIGNTFVTFNQIITLENLLILVIIIAGSILGSVIAYNIFSYNLIPLSWKIAITTFIVFLPVSFFLQAFFNHSAIKDERMSRIRQALADEYYAYISNNKDDSDAINIDFKNNRNFDVEIEKRSDFMRGRGHIKLDSIYRQVYLNIKSLTSDSYEKKRQLLNFQIEGEEPTLSNIVDREMKAERIDFRSFLLPLSFFLFMYFTGFLIILPLINSVFIGSPQSKDIPLFLGIDHIPIGIPLPVVQWGFVGGLVYTSISLLNRLLRKDLTPRVYFNSSFRLILSAVTAAVIYFLYIFINGRDVSASILFICFLAGVAPIQFLINFADTYLSRIYRGWRRRNTAGDRPVVNLEGMNSVISERLGEEGIDYIQQMALSDPSELALKTKFPLTLLNDWKDQAILYLIAGDVVFDDYSRVDNAHIDTLLRKRIKKRYLADILDEKLGIRTMSSLIKVWTTLNNQGKNKKQFFKGLGLLSSSDENIETIEILFDNIITVGKSILEESNISIAFQDGGINSTPNVKTPQIDSVTDTSKADNTDAIQKRL